MARTETLQLLTSLIEELQPLGQMTPGRPLRAAEWNDLVDALRTVAQVAVSREATTDDFLDDRYARTDHEHIGQIGLTWFDPPTRKLVEESIGGAVEQRAALKAARDEIAQLRATIEDFRNQFTQLRAQIDGVRDSDSARERELGRVSTRVEALRDVETRVSGLDQRFGSIATNVEAALAFRNELVDANGQPINVRGFGTRIGELEQLRDNLRTASGNIVNIRTIESAIARLESNTVDRAVVDSVVVGRLRDPAVVAQSGLVETVRGQVETAFQDRFAGIDQTTTRLSDENNQTRGGLAAQDTRITQHDSRIAATEAQTATLGGLPGRVDLHDTRLTDMDTRLISTQAAVGEIPTLRTQIAQLQTGVADIATIRTSLTQLDGRVRTVEGNTATIDGLVTAMQQTGTRVSTIEQALPALRQAAQLTAQHATVIAQFDTRIRAAEAELDNVAGLPSRFDGITVQLRDFAAFQASATQRLDELSRRTLNFDSVTTRLTAVESLAAENRNSLARVDDTFARLNTEVQTVSSTVRGFPTNLGATLRGIELRLIGLERRPPG